MIKNNSVLRQLIKASELYWIAVFCVLIFSKPFDFGNFFWGLNRQGEFFSLIVRAADILIIVILLSLIFKLFNNFLKSSLADKISKFLLFASGTLFTINWLTLSFNEFTFLPALFRQMLVLWICIDALQLILVKNKSKQNFILLLFVPYLFFDHLILTNSIATLSFFSIYLCIKSKLSPTSSDLIWFKHQIQKIDIFKSITLFLFWITLILNLGLAVYQTSTGSSFGLHWLGEPYLKLGLQTGIATQNIFDQLILRSYGLTAHPNILGIVGLFLLVYSQSQLTPNEKYHKVLRNIASLLSILLVFITLSRMAIVGVAIVLLFRHVLIGKNQDTFSRFETNNKYDTQRFQKYFLASFILLIGINLIATFFNVSKLESDSYRLRQNQYWLQIIRNKPYSIFTGIGPGQYAPTIARSGITTQTWENEPNYNPTLLLLIEWGIFPIIMYSLIFRKLDQ